MAVTSSSIVTCESLVQLLYVPSPNVTLAGITVDSIPELLNAYLPTVVRLEGHVNDFSDPQPEKALLPILVTVSGTDTELRSGSQSKR